MRARDDLHFYPLLTRRAFVVMHRAVCVEKRFQMLALCISAAGTRDCCHKQRPRTDASFSLYQVTKAYSKVWSFRESALQEVSTNLHDVPRGLGKEESRNQLRQANVLLSRAMKGTCVFESAFLFGKSWNLFPSEQLGANH